MEPQPPGSRAFVIYAQPKPHWIKDHIVFRLAVFTLAFLAGYFFTQSLYLGLHLFSASGAGTPAKPNPLIEMLRILHWGFTR